MDSSGARTPRTEHSQKQAVPVHDWKRLSHSPVSVNQQNGGWEQALMVQEHPRSSFDVKVDEDSQLCLSKCYQQHRSITTHHAMNVVQTEKQCTAACTSTFPA